MRVFILILVFAPMFVLGQSDSTLTLDTVSVRKSPIRILADRTIVSMTESNVAGLNTLEALRNTPGVAVDPQDNISLLAKSNVTILIDGRPTGVGGSDLAQLLKSIPASEIAEVELITQPSAKYEAAGNAGIINIRMKVSKIRGFNGNVSSSYTKSINYRSDLSGSFNFRQYDFNLFGNVSVQRGRQFVDVRSNRFTTSTAYTQNGREDDRFGTEALRLGTEIRLSNRSSIGGAVYLSDRFSNYFNLSETEVINTNLSTIETQSSIPFNYKQFNSNIHYEWSTAKNKFEINIDRTNYESDGNLQLRNIGFGPGNQLTSDSRLRYDQIVAIRLYALRADYSTETGPVRYEAGFRAGFSNTENRLLASVFTSDWKIDSSVSNRFEFSETVVAAYASASGSFNKWEWKAGIRPEYTIVRGQSVDLKANKILSPRYEYLNFFPSVFLQRKLANDNVLQWNYSYRIDRPVYQDQNPFIYQLDAFNSEQGNEELRPQFTHSMELRFATNRGSSVTISASQTDGLINQITLAKGEGTVAIPLNSGFKRQLGLTLSSPFKFTSHWSGYFTFTPFFQYFNTRLNSDLIINRSIGANGYMSNNFKISESFSGEVSGWLNFQNRTTIYYTKPLGSISVSFRKKVLNDRGMIRFGMHDVFNWQRWAQEIESPEVKMDLYRKWESRGFFLSLSLRFGNQKLEVKKKEIQGSNERIK